MNAVVYDRKLIWNGCSSRPLNGLSYLWTMMMTFVLRVNIQPAVMYGGEISPLSSRVRIGPRFFGMHNLRRRLCRSICTETNRDSELNSWQLTHYMHTWCTWLCTSVFYTSHKWLSGLPKLKSALSLWGRHFSRNMGVWIDFFLRIRILSHFYTISTRTSIVFQTFRALV